MSEFFFKKTYCQHISVSNISKNVNILGLEHIAGIYFAQILIGPSN
jgi:hypothetical protein